MTLNLLAFAWLMNIELDTIDGKFRCPGIGINLSGSLPYGIFRDSLTPVRLLKPASRSERIACDWFDGINVQINKRWSSTSRPVTGPYMKT